MDQGKILTREDFLSGNHLRRELVEVEELGGAVYMRELSTAQLLSFRARVKQLQKSGAKETTPDQSIELIVLIISMTVCDQSGQLLFTKEDMQKLMDNKPAVIIQLGSKALEMVGLDNQLMSEVAANLKNEPMTSLSIDSDKSSTKRRKRSSASRPQNS